MPILSELAAASPVLRAAEEAVPGGSAVVVILATVSLAVIVQGLMTSPQPPAGAASSSNARPARRRDALCDLALEPDGSKDKSNRAWRRELSPEVYASLRESVTDPPNLTTEEGGFEDNLQEHGVFVCAGCGSAVYDNDSRFEAGCGWPCFITCVRGAVRERRDPDGERMELVCNACNGHLGHAFRNEGWSLPPPAERHCVNSRSLRFVARESDDEDEDGAVLVHGDEVLPLDNVD